MHGGEGDTIGATPDEAETVADEEGTGQARLRGEGRKVHLHATRSICTFFGGRKRIAHRTAGPTRAAGPLFPVLRALDRLFPAGDQLLHAAAVHCGLEDTVDSPIRGDVGGVLPIAHGQAGEIAGA